MRVRSMGVYPIQRINSQVLDQDDVSKTDIHTVQSSSNTPQNLKKKTKKQINKQTKTNIKLSYFVRLLFLSFF